MSMHRVVQQVVRGLVPIVGFAAAVSIGGTVKPEPAHVVAADSAAPREASREHLLAIAPGLSPNALDLALRARARAIQQGMTRSPILTVIDYSLPSTVKRLWVLDVERQRLLFHELVAHGKGTGDNLARSFSNRDGSNASSLGAFLTGPTYLGKHGLSLRLRGLEAGFNDRAERRGIVVHGASYVSEAVARALGRLGRSQGCPAVPDAVSADIIRTIKDGTLLFSYFPEPRWLGASAFLKHG